VVVFCCLPHEAPCPIYRGVLPLHLWPNCL